MPVSEAKAFVFNGHDRPGQRARTLREFVAIIASGPSAVMEGHVRRGDFSRWIRGVFGDRALADELSLLEERHRGSPGTETIPEIIEAVRGRYDLTGGADAGDGPTAALRSRQGDDGS